MKIKSEILTECSYLSNEAKCLLYIIFFHNSGLIYDNKRKGMFKSLRDGKLLFPRNGIPGIKGAYHSKINDKWYNDDFILDIFEDILCDKTIEPIEFDVLIENIQLYLNKTKNYCIDFIFEHILRPFTQSFYYSGIYRFKYLETLGIAEHVDVRSIEDCFDLDLGYCCEDCDGDLETYKSYRYEYYYVDNYTKEVNKYINDYLNSKRNKGNKFTPNYSIY